MTSRPEMPGSDNEAQPKRLPIYTLSTNATLFWRIFFPVFSTVFLFGLFVAFYLTDDGEMIAPRVSVEVGRLALAGLMGLWIFLLYRSIWRLKRVDADMNHLFVTNYWTTVRYPWAAVDCIEYGKLWNKQTWIFNLQAPGRFGRKIIIFPDRIAFQTLRDLEKGNLLSEKKKK
jgi:hypothetical protein